MKSVGASALGHLADLGPLCMRVGVGAVFAVHGWQKYDQIGVSNFASFLDSFDIPAPETVAWLMTIAEGIGGLMLIVGLLTRLVTLPLIAIMIGAITIVKVDLPGVGFVVDASVGIGWELETALLAGLLGLLFVGPGRISLDGAFGMETAVAPVGAGRRVDERTSERA
jgi:putative oxidoreductase